MLADRTFFGTLCGVDPDPKRFTPRQTELLVVLARLLATQIERDRELAERRRAETALAAERDLLRTVTDAIPDQIYVKDAESRFVRLNRAAAVSFGVAAAAAAIGTTDADFFPPARARAFLADERRIVATGQPLLDHLESRAAEGGEPRWALTSKVPLRDATGAVTGIVGIGRDMTSVKRTEDALRESEARFRAFMDHQPTIAFLKDPDGRYVYANQPFERLFGVALADIRGKRDEDWLPPAVAADLRANDRRVLETGDRIEAVEPVPLADGTPRSWLSFKFPVTDAADRRFVGGVALDITDRERSGRHAALRADVSGILARAVGAEAVLRDATAAIVRRLGVARATAWLVDETGSSLVLRAAAGDDPASSA